MLEKIKKWIKTDGSIEPFDPSIFKDPLAETIEWSPKKKGGTNFHTHRMVKVGDHRIEFKPTFGARLFSAAFIVAGIGFPLLFFSLGSESLSAEDYWGFAALLLFTLIFTTVGAWFYISMGKPRVFDKWKSMYWKGHKKPDYIYRPEDRKNAAMLNRIHAIQLIREYVKSDKSSYYSYELNLVLKDGGRLNVVDHGNKSEIIRDAYALGEFLAIPVWIGFDSE